ncbi:uncharacterized protein LOC123318884 isoform X2 [Coccinella septempunctata]|uniref:uncharacterized protein LOC123318884 isoform X2 n=1 Tax=Coccinella septempunctata TaxID=41139 RepID=UPI001D0753EC|nr:uncharacterized protein LOC123318884 isoform X2 [Coccinella septempunctata]
MLKSGKLSVKFDFEQSAFSPTEIDDSYLLYYRYPREEAKENNNSTIKKVDASKYTLPCQKYLSNGNDCATAQRVVYPIQAKTKSSGVDDGFKGEAAKCGSSIISLANMMVSGKIVRGFDVAPEGQNPADKPPQGFDPMMRRGSKSLPASPLGSPRESPKARKKYNKYFTGAFVDSDAKHQGSWILSNLLAKRETVSQSCDLIAEEESEDTKSLHPEEFIKPVMKKKSTLVPKPSELREMNFWSPTSM